LSLAGHTSKSHVACGLLGLYSDAFTHQICPPAFRHSKHLAEEERLRAAALPLLYFIVTADYRY
jgi:hypothetical protein